jgi:hypothetical protein
MAVLQNILVNAAALVLKERIAVAFTAACDRIGARCRRKPAAQVVDFGPDRLALNLHEFAQFVALQRATRPPTEMPLSR